jgi:hypothetical protein
MGRILLQPITLASPGLDPVVHVFILERRNKKTWLAGSSPAKAINLAL